MSGKKIQKLRKRPKVQRKQARRDAAADALHGRMVEQAMGFVDAKLKEDTNA